VKRLLHYLATLYDANCIVSYCFFCEVPKKNGAFYLLQEHDTLTPLTRRITERLLVEGKQVSTLKEVFDEVSDSLLASIVKRRVNEGDVRRQMGLEHLEPFPADLELHILKKCTKTVRKLRGKSWFRIVDPFEPDSAQLASLVSFFKRVPSDPVLSGRLSAHKKVMPSPVDLHLMVYSQSSGLPVLTKDSHFTAFSVELRALGHVTEIVSLDSVAL
jgi:hypothetical protein